MRWYDYLFVLGAAMAISMAVCLLTVQYVEMDSKEKLIKAEQEHFFETVHRQAIYNEAFEELKYRVDKCEEQASSMWENGVALSLMLKECINELEEEKKKPKKKKRKSCDGEQGFCPVSIEGLVIR